MKTTYFMLSYPGHGGGDFFLLNMANHPQPMTCLLEAFKEQMLRFDERRIDARKGYDDEIKRVFEFRKGKDVCVANLKCDHPRLQQYVRDHEGHLINLVRNPLAVIGKRFGRKNEEAKTRFQELYGRPPETEADLFEGTVLKYVRQFYSVYLLRGQMHGKEWPTIRLEDLNASIGHDGRYFQRVMKWLTGVEWPDDYIDFIREHHTPGHRATSRAIFDKDYNLLRLPAWGRPAWRDRMGKWGEDVSENGPAAYWEQWSDEMRARYLLQCSEFQQRLGYNQDHIGSTDVDWEQRGQFGEVLE